MLPAKMKPFRGVWLYTNTVNDPALSPASGPDRLVWAVETGTVSFPPVSPVALASPTRNPFATKFTTGSPAPRFAKLPPLIVKLFGAAARSIGFGAITAQVVHRVSCTVRLVLPTRVKPLSVWLCTVTVTDPALNPANGPDRLVWSVGNGTVSVPPVRPVALACPTSTPFATKFTTGNAAPRRSSDLPLIVKLFGAAARSIGLGVMALTPCVWDASSTSTQS